MARLVGVIHRWIGRSREEKPTPGMWDPGVGAELTDADVPVGSTFYEEDTGWEFTYRGGRTWELSPDSGRTALLIAKLDELIGVMKESLSEHRAIRRGMEQGVEENLEGG